MKIIEQFVLSKSGRNDDCEDLILVSDDFVLLLDGATSKNAKPINGISCGRWAVNVLSEAMKLADLHQPAPVVLRFLNNVLAEQLESVDYTQPPSACIGYYNRLRSEIVRYGDVSIIIGGKLHNRRTKIDDYMSEKRSHILEQAIASGKTIAELLEHDIGRNGIMEDLQQMHLYANRVCEFGYPVLNGHDIINDFIDVFPVDKNTEIILASDGYPHLQPTLAESEDALSAIIQEDPLCMRLFKSTKGVMVGQQSFDDRSFLRLRV